ncbi:hypothetical protein AVEN_134679-1 [Araneus ventricosus]|uniref:Uncharacterized protein n=1 Tax=Araneus ventricosus TaxID=182803 RepID=A0A4Y2F387_ARAVE|nr:hypothetical protein AVEN_134679-1 [Araneus ventricosus]
MSETTGNKKLVSFRVDYTELERNNGRIGAKGQPAKAPSIVVKRNVHGRGHVTLHAERRPKRGSDLSTHACALSFLTPYALLTEYKDESNSGVLTVGVIEPLTAPYSVVLFSLKESKVGRRRARTLSSYSSTHKKEAAK